MNMVLKDHIEKSLIQSRKDNTYIIFTKFEWTPFLSLFDINCIISCNTSNTLTFYSNHTSVG